MDITSILKKHPKRREFVLEILHEIQNHDPLHYISDDSVKKVAQHLNLPLAQIYGIIGYYSMLSTRPRGKYLIQVCKSPVCGMLGSNTILKTLKNLTENSLSTQTESNPFYIEEVECLGQCNESPCMMVNGRIYSNLTSEKIESIVLDLKQANKST